MKSTKYELLGFSGLVGVTLVLLALPSGEQERKALKSAAKGMVSTDVFTRE
ncbi:hypothetical protein SAMN05444722_3017 [Rhodovulum sp. ES.010]|uniref:hypothetical protein n=1 Tax=Rhodovulum sp. ES.010 TaxID=1882821 RepID=UPI000925CE44|nr:hypothetical protein [Rhodovulum sp. ES.010]SIO52044.1 hypothetical protein SAMN05444722_3017 [Rhodovulum sp. ES.010]